LHIPDNCYQRKVKTVLKIPKITIPDVRICGILGGFYAVIHLICIFQNRSPIDTDGSCFCRFSWTSTVMGEQVYLVKYYNYGANTIAVLISEKRLDSLLNYNDMSIKEAAFYLTDKKRENSVRFRRGLDIWRSDRESAETGSISIYRGSVLEDAYQMYYSDVGVLSNVLRF